MMFPQAPNPTRVQSCSPSFAGNGRHPLVLLHDGSGSTFSYFLLGKLHRDVWAIHNPFPPDAIPKGDGLDEMARRYIELLQSSGIAGPVLLGGWSFGGYVSLVMARILAEETESTLSVAGIVLIDTVFHQPNANNRGLPPGMLREGLPTEFPESVKCSFERSYSMLRDYELPSWNDATSKGATPYIDVAGNGSVLVNGHVLHKPLGGSWVTAKVQTHQTVDAHSKCIGPPPALLMRAVRPTPGSSDDVFRGELLLGWSGRYHHFIKAVIDVDTDHFTIFDKTDSDKMDRITSQLDEGLTLLDGFQSIPTPEKRP